MSELALKRTKIKAKSITTALAVAAAIILPQIFHAVGILSGTGNQLGATLLPMQIPVLLAGLLAGPIVGIIAGAISPLISFAISGMPAVSLLPFMSLELAAYGLAGGLLWKVNMPVIAKLLIVQVAGRTVRALAVISAVTIFGSQAMPISSIWNMVVTALPGIVLQWALIPLLMYRMKGLKKHYD